MGTALSKSEVSRVFPLHSLIGYEGDITTPPVAVARSLSFRLSALRYISARISITRRP